MWSLKSGSFNRGIYSLAIIALFLLNTDLLYGARVIKDCSSYAGDIVINELRASGGGSNVQFVELKVIDANVDVEDWSVCYSSKPKDEECEDVGVGDGYYYYGSAQGDADTYTTYEVGTYLVYELTVGSNSGEAILLDADGDVVDYLLYSNKSDTGICSDFGADKRWHVPGACGSCLFDHAPNDKDMARLPDGTGAWTDNGNENTMGSSNDGPPPLPVADYHLDECKWEGEAGDALDSSGNGLHATSVANPVSIDTRDESQGICQAATMAGTSHFSVTDNDLLDMPDNLTVMSWIRPDAVPASGLKSIISKDENYEYHLNSSSEVYWWWKSGGQSYTLTTISANIQPGQWYHVVIRFSAGEASIFINGALAITRDGYPATLDINSDPLQIGGDFISSRYFQGAIDEVMIFQQALTDTAIQDIYGEQAARNNYDGSLRDCELCAPEGFGHCFSDEFDRGDLGSQWSIIKEDNFTPQISSEKMVLTSAGGSISAGVTLEGTFPAANNFAEIVFEHNAYGGSGADGVVLVLSDAEVDPVAGAYGGSLGYANRNGRDGFAGGWLGVGIDEYGNYSNPTEGRHEGIGFVRDAVAIRGQGDEEDGYEYITGTGQLDPGVDVRSSSSPEPGHLYRFTFDTRSGTTMIKVDRDTVGDGDNFATIIDWHDATQSATPPENFRISLTGSTGGATNVHSIDDFVVKAVECGSIGSSIDHYEIIHDGSALTCSPEQITIVACENDTCTVKSSTSTTVTLTPTGWVDGDNFTFTGSGDVQLRHTSPGTVTLGMTSQTVLPENGYRCVDTLGGVSVSCEMDFHESGFDFSIPTQTSCKLSEDIIISAIRKDEVSEKCVPGFSNRSVDVSFFSSYIMPDSGDMALEVNNESVSGASPGSAVRLDFDENGQSVLKVRYPDAGQLQLDARYEGTGDETGLIMTGNDSFVTHPAGLCVLSGPSASECGTGDGACSTFVAAGQEFALKVKGVCWEADGEADTDFCDGNSDTPNFRLNNVSLTHNLVAPLSGVPGYITELNVDIGDDGEGVVDQVVSEVGVFTFTADPPTDYLGAGDVFAGETFTSANIGRFIPDHFKVSIDPDPPSFSDRCISFTYIGQPFNWEVVPKLSVSAMNGMETSEVTENYEGDFWKLDKNIQYKYEHKPEDLAAEAAVLPLSPATSFKIIDDTSDIGGVGTIELIETEFNYLRPDPGTPVAPFSAMVTLTLPKAELTDSDGVCFTDTDESVCVDYLKEKIGGVNLRHGRIHVFDNFGPELDDITFSPFSVEYWTGTSWVTNADDSCTIGVVFDQPSRASVTSSPEVESGTGTLTVSSDNTINPIEVNCTEPVWLSCPASSSCSGVFTFGISRGNDRIINWQELSR